MNEVKGLQTPRKARRDGFLEALILTAVVSPAIWIDMDPARVTVFSVIAFLSLLLGSIFSGIRPRFTRLCRVVLWVAIAACVFSEAVACGIEFMMIFYGLLVLWFLTLGLKAALKLLKIQIPWVRRFRWMKKVQVQS